MKQIAFGLMLALMAACNAGATVINFEDLSGQAALPAGYAGLTWSDGWEYYDSFQFPYTPSSGVERVYNNNGSYPPRFYFSTPVTFDGAYLAGFSTATFEMYLLGSLVGTSSTVDLGGTGIPVWLASGYSGSVDEVRMLVSQGSFVMDDVSYNGGRTVPEPATCGLLGAGLAGLAILRRRR